MSVYLIADIKITDDAWVPSYATHVHDLVAQHDGKYLARCGNVQTIEGPELDTSILALIEFPSRRAAAAFVEDPAYAPFAQARKAGSVSHIHIIDDSDVAGTIPYLRKG